MEFTGTQLLSLITVASVVFAVYRYFRDPQVKSDQTDALILQERQIRNEEYERRFNEIQKSVREAFNLADNHTHTVEMKTDALTSQMTQLIREVGMLRTIIDERIPKK